MFTFSSRALIKRKRLKKGKNFLKLKKDGETALNYIIEARRVEFKCSHQKNIASVR